MRLPKPAPMRIWADTREGLPWEFDPAPKTWCPNGLTVETKMLPVADYTTAKLWRHLRVERKSGPDFYSSLVHHRDRFEREMVKLARFHWPLIVVECGWHEFQELGRFGLADPHAITQSVASLFARHGVPTFFAPSRETAMDFVVGTMSRCEEELAKMRRPFAMYRRTG